MVDSVFEDFAGFEDPLAPWRHGKVPVDKLDGVWEFAEVGIGIVVIRGHGAVPWRWSLRERRGCIVHMAVLETKH